MSPKHNETRKRPREEDSSEESQYIETPTTDYGQMQNPSNPSSSVNQQNLKPAVNSYLTNDAGQGSLKAFEGTIWDSIVSEVEVNDASRRVQAEQDPEAHASALADFQRSQQPRVGLSREQRLDAARRLSSLRNLTGNDDLSRALHDLPDAVHIGNQVHQAEHSLLRVENSKDAKSKKAGAGQQSGTKGVSHGANHFLRLN
ncbi:hypothetical protein PMZ80_004195 [Knufia obscura]|uniref:Uncharacterized protein n=1 Tax=Knufia obscura TaxID=1635080 RepID=A0ABR0RSI5_9EURO|nr:hypothetical protein PMZ80_004195 [Knufia obscura]